MQASCIDPFVLLMEAHLAMGMCGGFAPKQKQNTPIKHYSQGKWQPYRSNLGGYQWMWTSDEKTSEGLELKTQPKVTNRGFDILTGDKTKRAATTAGSAFLTMLVYDVLHALTFGLRRRCASATA
eukprot:567258-Prorocentrum_minimum.AAC.2